MPRDFFWLSNYCAYWKKMIIKVFPVCYTVRSTGSWPNISKVSSHVFPFYNLWIAGNRLPGSCTGTSNKGIATQKLIWQKWIKCYKCDEHGGVEGQEKRSLLLQNNTEKSVIFLKTCLCVAGPLFSFLAPSFSLFVLCFQPFFSLCFAVLGTKSGVFQGVWEQVIYVYWPHCAKSRALLTGPEADVHFREVAGERFRRIIKVRGETTAELQEPLTKNTAGKAKCGNGSITCFSTCTSFSASLHRLPAKSRKALE